MSRDEKERVIAQYNRQRTKRRRKASTVEQVPEEHVSARIEPLVKESESRTRRPRKPANQPYENNRNGQGRSAPQATDAPGTIHADHPI